MTPREAIVRMLASHDRLPMACARAIKRYEGWKITDGEAYKRMIQTLRGSADRHFEIDWYPIVIRMAVHFEVPELVVALFDEVRRDAEHEKKTAPRKMLSVRPREARREVG